MLHLLQPIWLLASAGIIVPVVIHLWNTRQGKTLKIGSIELLASTAQQRARSLRFTELFLLLLRCLLIILLALLLAKPYWQNTSKQKGWIVVQEKNAGKAYDRHRLLIDSLSNEGYRLHFFKKGFPATDLSKIKAAVNDTATTQTSYWQLLKMLDRQLPSGMPVYLFTENEMLYFSGERPEISIALNWKTFSNGDSVHSFIAGAYETTRDSIAVVMGTTKSEGTAYHIEMLAANQPVQRSFSIGVSEGNMQVGFKNGPPVVVDTAPVRVSIFAEPGVDDPRYVAAALQSIKQVTGRKIIAKTFSKIQDLAAGQDWLFWLSVSDVPAQANARRIFSYAKGKPAAVESWIEDNKNIYTKVELYQRVPYRQNRNETEWRDGFGVPLLTKETKDGKVWYECFTHFNPSWNELVWDASFPQRIYELIGGFPAASANKDHRGIDESQLKFDAVRSVQKTIAADTVDATATARVFWMIIFILFCAERYFSYRIKKIKADA